MKFDSINLNTQSGQSSLKSDIYSRFGKRIFDVLFALALLPILIPVIAVLWALTRRDGGPGFYAQDRVGLNGKTFRCYKMRTMVMNAEKVLQDLCDADPVVAAEWLTNQKLANDPRITRVGRILRATSLDELPQIWNVLCGEMSFVGPRPFMVEQDALYRSANGEAYYHLRPGITGLWQIEGRGTTSFLSRVQYDNDYLERISVFLDAKLIIKTVTVVFNRTGH